jgi:hypothetical protein
MFVNSVYDLIGGFGIDGGNHLGTAATVEEQLITLSYFDYGHITGPDRESTTAYVAGNSSLPHTPVIFNGASAWLARFIKAA